MKTAISRDIVSLDLLLLIKTKLQITKANIIPTLCAPFTKFRLLSFPILTDNNTEIAIRDAYW